MTEHKHDRIAEIIKDRTAIDAALARATRKALQQHKQAGNPIAVWRDGAVVWLPPEEIIIPDESQSSGSAL